MFIMIYYLLLGLSVLESQCASIHRIVGGSDATECEFPHIMFLDIVNDMKLFQCSGSLIDDRHIITAAHCVQGDVNRITAWFGSLNVYSMSDGIHVSNITQHEGYKETGKTILNDVALLTLSRPVKFTACLKPIRLAEKGEAISENCEIAGWGKTSQKMGTSSHLLRASVPLQSAEACARIDSNIIQQHVCAGTYTKNGKSTCQGDSGGPLMCKSKKTGEKLLVGIVSYGWTCKEGLAVFARVAYFKNWIEQHL